MKTMGKKISEARSLLGMNQTELADRVGVSRRSVIKYEADETRPRSATVKSIADVLGVSAAYLEDNEAEDPTYGLSSKKYVEEIRSLYDGRAAREISYLMDRNEALFAGGDISDDVKDEYFRSVMRAYLECKRLAEEKRKGRT